MLSIHTIFTLILLELCCCYMLPQQSRNGVEIFSININNRTIPQQVHISRGEDNTQMYVIWNTLDPTTASIVWYGIGSLQKDHLGNMSVFSNGPGHIQYIHTALMDELLPSSTYMYQVGSGNAGEDSAIYTFNTTQEGTNWSPRFCVYGDMGLENAQSLPSIHEDVKKGIYDMILHVGDFAYDMNSNFGDIGDKFMRLIEPVAANIPYMTTPGNHENSGNFSNYKNRFRMPNNDNGNMFYSYNVGPVHIISMSTEFYFYINYGIFPLLNQFDWLVQDLKTANLPENRENQPWIFFLGHRPIYCTNNDSNDCTICADWLRYGIPVLHVLGLEDLLYQYGVDLALWAHEHSYERMWPVYGEKVVNSSTPGQPYTNPRSTVHIVTGSAGCNEDHDTFPRLEKPYSAFHSMDYGFSRITVQNQTHLYFEQVSVDKGGKIIDSILLIRDKHGPFI